MSEKLFISPSDDPEFRIAEMTIGDVERYMMTCDSALKKMASIIRTWFPLVMAIEEAPRESIIMASKILGEQPQLSVDEEGIVSVTWVKAKEFD